jgi:hypothetical protein
MTLALIELPVFQILLLWDILSLLRGTGQLRAIPRFAQQVLLLLLHPPSTINRRMRYGLAEGEEVPVLAEALHGRRSTSEDFREGREQASWCSGNG